MNDQTYTQEDNILTPLDELNIQRLFDRVSALFKQRGCVLRFDVVIESYITDHFIFWNEDHVLNSQTSLKGIFQVNI